MTDVAPSRFLQGQRRIFIAVFAVICAMLVLAYYLFLRTDYAVLYTGLKPTDASAILAHLDAKGISHRLRDDGTTILVPSDQADTVRLAVAGSDIAMKGAVGFELFNKSDMGLTDFAQKINYQRALQGELARTIMSMDGIDSARVHLAIPEHSLYRADRTPPKAAVEVTAKLGHVLTADRVAGIQQLVASAVPDLSVTDVSVLDADGRIVSVAPVVQVSATPEFEERGAVQAYYSARAKAAIAAQVPGLKFDVRTLVLPRGDGNESPTLPARTEGVRDFQLRIIVLTLTALGTEEQVLARAAVANAVGLDEARGDTITFELGPVAAPVVHATEPSARSTSGGLPPAASIPAASVFAFETLGWMAGVGLAFMLFAVVLLRARRPGLSAAERAAFVDRIRAELRANGASHG